jgi:flagellar basal-body rod protein FlgC
MLVDYNKVINLISRQLDERVVRGELIASNIANINATRTLEGGPYRRRDVVFESKPVSNKFEDVLDSVTAGVEVVKVVEDPSPFKKKFDPNHPDAGPDGYVLFPNVDVVSEVVNMQEAARAYEANIAVIVSIKGMLAKTFEIGRR